VVEARSKLVIAYDVHEAEGMGRGNDTIEVERVHVVGVFEDLAELRREEVELRLAQSEASEFGDVRDVLTPKR